MRRKQRGITLIGWICLLIPLAITIYGGIRLAPMYLNYSRVARSMNEVASEQAGAGDAVNVQSVKVALAKRLDIEGITFPELDMFVIRRDGKVWVIDANYEEGAPLFYNVSLIATFKKQVTIGKGAAE